jgi:hypothetical protein
MSHPGNHTGMEYRGQLQRLAEQRANALGDASQAAAEIGRLLPQALRSGVSVVEAAHLTGVSRPTLYRMLAEARQQQDLRGTIVQFEAIMDKMSGDTDNRIYPADLATFCQRSVDETFEQLMQIYRPLADEFAGLGPTAITRLVAILTEPEPNEFQPPEREILKMLLLHDMPLKRVAWSNGLSETEVLGWAALGLLRVLPRMRTPI